MAEEMTGREDGRPCWSALCDIHSEKKDADEGFIRETKEW